LFSCLSRFAANSAEGMRGLVEGSSEPSLQPLFFVSQFGPAQGKAAVGQHRLQYHFSNPVGRRFRVGHQSDQKMFFPISRMHGGPFAQQEFLWI